MELTSFCLVEDGIRTLYSIFIMDTEARTSLNEDASLRNKMHRKGRELS